MRRCDPENMRDLANSQRVGHTGMPERSIIMEKKTATVAAKEVVKKAEETAASVTEAVKKEAPKAKAAAKSATAKASTAAKKTTIAAKAATKKAGTAAKKTAAKAETAVKKATKEAVKKAETVTQKTVVNLQFDGRSYNTDQLLSIARDVWKYDLNQKPAELKSIELYVKPDEKKTYYVMNGQYQGSFFI